MKKLITILLIGCVSLIKAQQYTHHQISGNYGRGLLMGHLARISHLPQKSSNLFELNYTKYGKNLPGFGLGINYIESGNQASIGSITGVYGFTDLIFNKKDTTLRFKIGFGAGYVEKIYTPNNNNKNIAIGSHLNSNVIFRIEKNVLLNKHACYFGAGLTHFSNGSSQTPNLGLNFLSLNIGYSLYQPKQKNVTYTPQAIDSQNKLFYGIAYRIGIRENFEPSRKKYTIHTLSPYIKYTKNHKRNYLGGLDIFYNPSIQFYGQDLSPIRLGGYLGKEWGINRLLLGIDIGFYVFDQYKENGISYQRLNIHYFLSEKIKATFLLKSHWTVAQAFQIGIAYELKK
ncbi:MAG: acyloxyacyl hydrolase [Flavobacteriales bacterium]|nr:acyloxyacyl hydrolase [Flavobacteriales bacterium]